MKLIKLIMSGFFALAVAGCTTSQQVSAQKDEVSKAARRIIGNSLPGAIGATPADQKKIDTTVARACAPVFVYTPAECRRHTEATKAAN